MNLSTMNYSKLQLESLKHIKNYVLNKFPIGIVRYNLAEHLMNKLKNNGKLKLRTTEKQFIIAQENLEFASKNINQIEEHMTIDEIEEALHFQYVFHKHNNENEIASLGAYMTIFDYDRFKYAFNILPCSKQDWKDFAEYCDHQAYLSPTFTLVSKEIKRLLDIAPETPFDSFDPVI